MDNICEHSDAFEQLPGIVDTSQVAATSEPKKDISAEENYNKQDDFMDISCGSPIDATNDRNEQIDSSSAQSCSTFPQFAYEASLKQENPSISEQNFFPRSESNVEVGKSKTSCPIKINRDIFKLSTCNDSEEQIVSYGNVDDDSGFSNISSGTFNSVCDVQDIPLPSTDGSSSTSDRSFLEDSSETVKFFCDTNFFSENLITQSASKGKGPLVSNDRSEIRDNDDPEWEVYKKLKTDDERYRVVKNMWKNTKIPNPNKDLTYLSYRKRHLVKTEEKPPKEATKRKRERTSDSSSPPAKRSRGEPSSCTKIMVEKFQKESAKYDLVVGNLINKYEERFRSASAVHTKSREEISDRIRRFESTQCQDPFTYMMKYGSLVQKKLNLISHYYQELKNIYQKHLSCLDNEEKAYNCRMKKLVEANTEVLSFYKFYQGLGSKKDPTILEGDQMKELKEISDMYEKYNFYYETLSKQL